METAAQKLRERHLQGIRNFAAADRSDPFTFQRAMAHLRAGILSNNAAGDPAWYNADPFQVERSYIGYDGEPKTYHATEYKNLQRP